jgi:hypothetical protein
MRCNKSAVMTAGTIAIHGLRREARNETMAAQRRPESRGMSMKLRGSASSVARWK